MISDTNARLATARRLTRRQARREAGRFLAEGAQAVREALRHPKVVVQVFATADGLARNADLVDEARAARIRVDEISVRAASAARGNRWRPRECSGVSYGHSLPA